MTDPRFAALNAERLPLELPADAPGDVYAWSARAEHFVRRMAYSDDEVLISVANILRSHAQQLRFETSISGKVAAAIYWMFRLLTKALLGWAIRVARWSGTATDPSRMEIDGNRLAHLLRLAEVEAGAPIDPRVHYKVEVAGLADILNAARDRHSRSAKPYDPVVKG